MNPFRWFLPTFHGDILLERVEDQMTSLRAFELTPSEKKALEALRTRAVKPTLGRSPWASEKDFLAITNAQYRTRNGVVVTLKASITDVQKVLAKALKPERKLLSVVKFTGGALEEVHADGPFRTSEKPKKDALAETEPEAAVTVAKPVIGCPMPEFEEADVRASRVLETFLDSEQITDYRKHGMFVSVGADTGHRYLIAHRQRPAALKRCGGRQLFDLETQKPLCVHDWSIPPAEEMLALHLCLRIPGNEGDIRLLPHAYE